MADGDERRDDDDAPEASDRASKDKDRRGEGSKDTSSSDSSEEKGKDDEDSDRDSKSDDGDKKDGEGKKKPEILRKPWFIALLMISGVVLLVVLIVYYVRYQDHGRFQQSTNDAYLDADQANIASRVSGYIAEVLVADNQNVAAGQPLARIVSDNYEATAAKDQAQIAQYRARAAEIQAQMIQQAAKVEQTRAQLDQDRADRVQTAAGARFDRSQAVRYTPLAATGAESGEKAAQYRSDAEQSDARLSSADHKVRSGAADLKYQQRQMAVLQAQLVSALAQVQEGEAQLASDKVDLDSTGISSRIAGRVGDRTARVGQYVQAGTRLMTVVPVGGVFLRANFKETQIGLMRVGQPVTIKVDALKGAVLHGVVDSFSPGTGAQFALAPKDNSTGNFTKIVQRVPVKVRIDAGEEARKVLVPGLSVSASVDTTGAKADEKALKDESKRAKRDRADAQRQEDRQDRRQHALGAGRE